MSIRARYRRKKAPRFYFSDGRRHIPVKKAPVREYGGRNGVR